MIPRTSDINTCLILQAMELCYHGAEGRMVNWDMEMQKKEQGLKPYTIYAAQNAQQCTVEQSIL